MAPTAAAAGADGLSPSGIGSWLLKNPSVALGGLGLASSVLSGDKKNPLTATLEQQAANANAQGQQLSSYLTSGQLPPGVATSLQSAHDAAAATIKSQHASHGTSGSSAEAQDLANLANTTVAQGAQIASSLLSQGISEQNFASQLYGQLLQQSIAQDAALSNSIAQFSGALAGSGLRASR